MMAITTRSSISVKPESLRAALMIPPLFLVGCDDEKAPVGRGPIREVRIGPGDGQEFRRMSKSRFQSILFPSRIKAIQAGGQAKSSPIAAW